MPRTSNESGIPIIYHSSRGYKELNHGKNKPFESIADVLKWEDDLRRELFGEGSSDRLQEIWFRGTSKHFDLVPGIYRKKITDLANDTNRDWSFGNNPRHAGLEKKRLNVERDMMLTFEREAGPLLQYKSEQELYFLARHYGMPSRLLDWSISPLIALFMCVFPEPSRPPRAKSAQEEEQEEDGVIYAMDPHGLKPPGYICHQNDPMVEEAIEKITMWNDKRYKQPGNPGILPIRPHTLAGRIDRQMSRFTLHCHGAKAQQNSTLHARRVSKKHKNLIRNQLERIGVNEFSVYYTLDRLVGDITDRFSAASL